MLANRIKETTASTGAGNLTLSGAVANFKTFTSAFGTDERFYYFIVDDTNNTWESGIGYITSTGPDVLVRETVLDNSSGTATAINFVAIDRVVCAHSKDSNFLNVGKLASAKDRYSAHHTSLMSTKAVSANMVFYMPFYAGFVNDIDALICSLSAAAGSNAKMALYDCVNGLPKNRLVQTATFIPSAARIVQSITQRNISDAWYFMAYVSDGADTLRAAITYSQNYNPLVSNNDNFGIGGAYLYEDIGVSWTDFPAVATPLGPAFNTPSPIIKVRTV